MGKDPKARFILELDIKPEIYQFHVLEKRFEIARKMYNACKGVMWERMHHMFQDPAYQHWLKQPKSEERSQHLKVIRESYDVSKTGAERIIDPMYKQFISKQKMKNGKPILHFDSLTAQKIAERVWKSISDYLFKNGKKVHFKKYGQMDSVEGKTNTSGICYHNGKVTWNGLEIDVDIDEKDTYAQKALHHNIAFCRIQRKMVRGKVKYYLQLILKGIPPQKQESMEGEVGVDIGISTIAAVSDHNVSIEEFCEGLDELEKEKRRLLRQMDRSRRATNPDKYHENGTINLSNKNPWVRSRNYRKILFRLKEVHRKIAAKRKILHHQTANRILRLGSSIYVEKMNYKGLQKGWFGKRIGHKAPSLFLRILETKLGYQGRKLLYVNTWKVKASQYDPFSNKYKKKRLSERFHITGDGLKIQRDCFSAFLLKHVNASRTRVDRKKCLAAFSTFYEQYQQMVDQIKVMNKTWISSMGF